MIQMMPIIEDQNLYFCKINFFFFKKKNFSFINIHIHIYIYIYNNKVTRNVKTDI
jgi:hypothetical protein